VKQLSEQEARQVLLDVDSPAAKSDMYRGDRVDGGWAFRWNDVPKKIPFGVRTWVVTDSGLADKVKLGEKAQTAITRLNG